MPKVSQNDLIEFGRAVERARSLKTWTLDELGGKLNPPVGKSFVSKVEKGRKTNLTSRSVGRFIAALEMDEKWIDKFIGQEAAGDDDETDAEKSADAIIAQIIKDGAAEGVTEALLIALANEYTEDSTTDLQSAYKGLRSALETARDMAARAELKDNTDASVAAIRARVDALNKDGEPDAAAEVIDDAIAQKTAEISAVLDLGVQQDRLRNNPRAAAEKLVMGLRLEAPSTVMFDVLRLLWSEWYQVGDHAGLNFEAAVAIYLAEAALQTARDADERAMAGENLAISLRTLASREGNSDKLETAVNVCDAALKELSRERVPQKWAKLQMHLGNALLSLGLLSSGADILRKSIQAYRLALEERTRDKVPLDWAMAQMNLGNALKALGERDRDSVLLAEAVDAFRDALDEVPREKAPNEWARTQMNLGGALRTLAVFENNNSRLKQAIVAYEAALEVWTQEKVPLEWAITQINLGNVQATIGEREQSTDWLEKARTAYQEALKEHREDRAPFDWAILQANFAILERRFFVVNNEADRLETATEYAKLAMAVFLRTNATDYVDWVQVILADIRNLQNPMA